MPNQYIAFIAIAEEGQKREDGLSIGELRFFWKNEDGEDEHHRLKSLHKYELEELMNQLGYKEDRILMKENLETYEASMRAMIDSHFEDHLELIKSGEKSEEPLPIVVVTHEVTLEEAIEKYKSDSESASETEKKEESIENDNNSVEPEADKEPEEQAGEEDTEKDEALDIE